MSEPFETAASGRRRFLKVIGLAGLSSTLAPRAMSFAQAPPPSPAPGAAPAKPDSAAAQAPAGPPEISEDARSLAEIVRRRYGKQLTPDQLESIASDFDGDLRAGKRLREAKLPNGDEPDFTFRA